jgi:hypothetical protein
MPFSPLTNTTSARYENHSFECCGVLDLFATMACEKGQVQTYKVEAKRPVPKVGACKGRAEPVAQPATS